MYIYLILESDTGVPFYVGQTNNINRRSSRHKYDAKSGKYYLHNKIRKLWRENKDFEFVIIEETTKDVVDEREIFHIKRLKNLGFKLCNLTEGGSGSKGMTPEAQKNAAKKRIGLKRSDDTKKKISDALKGKSFTSQHCKNLSKARKKRVTTPETRLKCSQTSKGEINTKRFTIVDPNGRMYVTDNGLTLFCEQHGLQASNMVKVANGQRKHHKGWTCKRES